MMATAGGSLKPAGLGNLYLSSQYSDAVILAADGEALSIHKPIVFPQAPRLARDFGEVGNSRPPFSMAGRQPSLTFTPPQQNKSHVSPWEAVVLKSLLQFLYTGDYEISVAQGGVKDRRDGSDRPAKRIKQDPSATIVDDGKISPIPPFSICQAAC